MTVLECEMIVEAVERFNAEFFVENQRRDWPRVCPLGQLWGGAVIVKDDCVSGAWLGEPTWSLPPALIQFVREFDRVVSDLSAVPMRVVAVAEYACARALQVVILSNRRH